MHFDWTSTQDELYRQTLAFARAELNRNMQAREQEQRFGREEWRRCGEFGLLGLQAPEAYGGRGLDALTTARVIEALGRGCEDGGLVFSIAAHLFACVSAIALRGSDRLKQELLPALCSGERIGATAITEPDAGSDVIALKTRAVRKGGEFVLSGVKSYVTNGPVADIVVVYAMQNPSHGYLGISAFAVETDRPGLVMGKPFHKLGLSTSPVCSMYLEDCCVPEQNLLGREGQGARVFAESIRWERSCMFAAYLGSMERQLEQTIEHVKQRQQFGRPLSKNQAVAHRIAEMKLQLEAAGLLLYRACWLIDQGRDAVLEIALSKVAVAEAALRLSLDALHLHGSGGLICGNGLERGLRDAIPASVFSGTSEIQKDLIASRLGL